MSHLNESKTMQQQQQQQQQSTYNRSKKMNGSSTRQEFGARRSSRKNQVSLNHLLELEYEDQPYHYETKKSNNNPPKRHFHKPKGIQLKGMAYINCNYKFIVDSRKDYRPQMLDPNIPVSTDNILSIIVPKGNVCPICLADEPIAPRMLTACGHILCLTCLFSLLDSEVPKAKKKEADIIVEKYRECPLCTSIIRLNEVVPVQFSDVDETFEVPKVKDDCVFTLMSRPRHKPWALPKSFEEYYNIFPSFPTMKDGNGSEFPDFVPYSRILLGGLDFITNLHNQEKQNILHQFELEKDLYGDDGKSVKSALEDISKSIEIRSRQFNEKLPNITIKNEVQENNYFYYQTGFNASSPFMLAPLDIKLLKATYGSYNSFPSTIIARVENIRYQELNADILQSKLKYLSYLPHGTNVGFVECNWRNNEFISKEAWELFSHELIQRSKTSNNKFNKEEKNKQIALREEEIRNREFFEQENGLEYATQSVSNLRINDLPVLNKTDASVSIQEDENEELEMATSVWGTQVPKQKVIVDEDFAVYDWDAEEMIRKAKEEQAKGKNQNKKKKKRVLLPLG